MTSFRKCSQFNCKNPNFILIILAMIVMQFIYVVEFMVLEKPSFTIPMLIIECISYALMVWSFVAAVVVDSGRVPEYFGLCTEEIDKQKERKYCLACLNFKPERCHHCSVCEKCVLNMDHHCPWINNCVGFFNRKYFILLLFYLQLTLLTVLPQMIIILISQFTAIFNGTRETSIHTALRLIGFLLCITLFAAALLFFMFHMKLVFSNSSTLEAMVKDKFERLRKDKLIVQSSYIGENQYDIGYQNNFAQVFGKNPIYWMIPVQGEERVGRGTVWKKKSSSVNTDVLVPTLVSEKQELQDLKTLQYTHS